MNLHPSHPAYHYPRLMQRYIVAVIHWTQTNPLAALYCAAWTGALAAAILIFLLPPNCLPAIQFLPAEAHAGSAQP